MLLSLVVVALAAAFVVFTTTGVIISQKREAIDAAQKFERYKADSAEKLSATQAEAAIANQAASAANERTAKNENEAAKLTKLAEDERLARVKIEESVAWRSLNDTERKRFAANLGGILSGANCAFLASDMEAFSFGADIAQALREDAHWQVIPPSPNMLVMKETSLPTVRSPIEKLDTGVEIKAAPDEASKRAGRVVAKSLNDLGFDASFVPSSEDPKQHGIWITVLHRPLGPQGQAKLNANKINK